MASSQEKLAKYDDAVRSRVAAKKIDPYNADNLLQLGRDYKETRQLDKAIAIIEEIKKFAPSSAEYQTALKELN